MRSVFNRLVLTAPASSEPSGRTLMMSSGWACGRAIVDLLCARRGDLRRRRFIQ
jgi:hypothetical protein